MILEESQNSNPREKNEWGAVTLRKPVPTSVAGRRQEAQSVGLSRDDLCGIKEQVVNSQVLQVEGRLSQCRGTVEREISMTLRKPEESGVVRT